MSLIPKWFIRKRGLASGLVLAGIGLGAMVLAPFVQVIINYAGWRFAFIVLAAIMFFLVAPVTAILQRRPPRHLERCAEGYFPNSHGISEDGDYTTFYGKNYYEGYEHLQYDESFFKNITTIYPDEGSVSSGDLDSLKYFDNDVLTLQTDPSTYKLNITFDFGVLFA